MKKPNIPRLLRRAMARAADSRHKQALANIKPPRLYAEYQPPFGVLSPHRAAHALMHYYMLASAAYEQYGLSGYEGDAVQYEGAKDNTPNYRQLYISVATIYGTTPDAMDHFWPEIDTQCALMGLPVLPNIPQLRHNTGTVINSTEQPKPC